MRRKTHMAKTGNITVILEVGELYGICNYETLETNNTMLLSLSQRPADPRRLGIGLVDMPPCKLNQKNTQE